MPSAPSTPPPGLAHRFNLIIGGLCAVTAARIAVDRSAGPLLILIVGRLRRLAARFAALAARVQAGAPPPASPRRPASARPPRPPRAAGPRGLPDGFAWLIRLSPGTAAYGGQVAALLSDPDLAALLAAAPQAGRILRPLCRMLALRPDPRLLPPPPRRVAPVPPPSRPQGRDGPADPAQPDPARPDAAQPDPARPGTAPPAAAGPAGRVRRRSRGISIPRVRSPRAAAPA